VDGTFWKEKSNFGQPILSLAFETIGLFGMSLPELSGFNLLGPYLSFF